jgi:hypothetical protein
LSILSSVVEDLVEVLVDQIKRDLRDYANDIILDVEALANRIIKRAVNVIVTSVVWMFMICVGAVFTLLGAVNFLIPVVGPALAWGLVGLLSAGLGAVQLKRPSSHGARRSPPLRDGE